IDKAMKSQWIVETQFGMGGLSPDITKAIAALPEARSVTGLRFTDVKVGGAVKSVSAFDPSQANANIELDLRAGDISKLGRHEVAVQVDEAKQQHLHVGDTVRMFFPESGVQPMHVVAIYGTDNPIGPYAMSI